MRYFISDLHMGHFGIIDFERTDFSTIEEHDNYIANFMNSLSKKLKPGDEVWNLGDYGLVDYLYFTDWIHQAGAKAYYMYGNHDRQSDLPMFEKYFDQVFLYPTFLSQKLVVSHFPVAVYPDTINVHGHLHASKLSDPNHMNASIHVAGYHPITDRCIGSRYKELPRFVRRFLYEPWAADYQFTQPKEDVIMTPDGHIDLSASRYLQKVNTDRRVQEGETYQPYHGQGMF